MKVKFCDMDDASNPLNGSTIQGSGRLLQILRGMQGREPFFCELEGGNGYRLDVGLAATFGCAQHSRSDGELPYLMAVDGNAKPEDGYREFFCQNTPTDVPARHCLPLDVIMQIAAFFLETGKPSQAVSWEEI
jgi:hypothetical protein